MCQGKFVNFSILEEKAEHWRLIFTPSKMSPADVEVKLSKWVPSHAPVPTD